jgi:hypothetical protein
MGDCCGEPGCRRKQPIRLYLADFSETVYATTRYTMRQPLAGLEARWRAVDRHDVTAQMREFIRRNPEWVRAQLEAS